MDSRIYVLAVLSSIVSAPEIRAQSAAVPKFEVVSIHPCRPDAPRGRSGYAPPNGPSEILAINCQTVQRLIEIAYDFLATGKPRFRASPIPIEGAPAWLHSERYTIEAKSETPQGLGMMDGPMMQRILEDRFKLKLRRRPTEVPVYLLTVAKGGPKNLETAKEGACVPLDLRNVPLLQPGEPDFVCGLIARRVHSDTGMAELNLRSTTLPNFAEQLSILADRDVIDKTGIAGTFDIHVEVPAGDLAAETVPDRDPATPGAPIDEAPLAFAAVRKLGLKLESARGPGEIFVIDHVERPSEN